MTADIISFAMLSKVCQFEHFFGWVICTHNMQLNEEVVILARAVCLPYLYIYIRSSEITRLKSGVHYGCSILYYTLLVLQMHF